MRFPAAALVLALASASPGRADELTIVSKVTGNDGAPRTSTTYVSSSKMRSAEGDGDMIVEFATGHMLFLDNKKKQYWETSAEEMKTAMAAMNAQLEAAQKQMEQQMANLPPAIREKMAAMTGGSGMLPAVKVEKSGTTRTVAGYSCDSYLMTMGESMRTEMCSTKDIPWPAQAYDARNALAGMGPANKGLSKMIEEMKKIQGFSLSETTTAKFMGKTITSSREVTEVKKGPVADSVFALPAGYKKVDSPFSKLAQKK